jgi:hypothetical protein
MSIHEFIRCYLAVAKTLARLTGGIYTFFQNGIAMIHPSSGSIGDNGALTLTTALPRIYANCYMYFPADKIAVGVPAGAYFVQMTSTTVGTIFNNTYTSGKPTIPTSPTAFATTGPGAYTQTTGSDITLLSFTLPGGAMGKNGAMFIYQQAAHPGNANQKKPQIKVGGTGIYAPTFTTQTIITAPVTLRNNGNEAVNIDNGAAGFSNSATLSAGYRTINTATDQTILYTSQLATATDYYVLEGLDAQIKPAA